MEKFTGVQPQPPFETLDVKRIEAYEDAITRVITEWQNIMKIHDSQKLIVFINEASANMLMVAVYNRIKTLNKKRTQENKPSLNIKFYKIDPGLLKDMNNQPGTDDEIQGEIVAWFDWFDKIASFNETKRDLETYLHEKYNHLLKSNSLTESGRIAKSKSYFQNYFNKLSSKCRQIQQNISDTTPIIVFD